MDTQLVLKMFKELKQEIAHIKLDVASLATTGQVSKEGRGKLLDLEQVVEQHDDDISTCQCNLKKQKTKESVLVGND